MIKSYCIAITEIDDEQDAISQLSQQLEKITLLKNSIAIIDAHEECIPSGIYAAVSKALPCPNIGATSMSQNANGECGSFLISALILTSDTCTFSCSVSDAVTENCDLPEISNSTYKTARAGLSEEPKLALLYAPFLSYHVMSEYFSPMSQLQPNLPFFGKAANDDVADASKVRTRTLINGSDYTNRFVLALIAGDISPKFYIASVTDECIIMPNIGEVTKTGLNKIIEINNNPALKFLEEAGLSLTGKNSGILTSTFLLNDKSAGSTVSRTPILIDDEGVICGGLVEPGVIMSVAFSTADVVVQTAKQLTDNIKKENECGTALLYSCIGRRYGLISEPLKELELIGESLNKNYTFITSFANGEICPTSVTPEKAENNEHNQTLVACVF